MKHISIPVENSIEFINISEVSPLISKCQIKVCYVGEQPNRNKTVITREFAKEMAKGLPGSPIVGYFNEQAGDFEEHNKEVLVKDGKFAIVDTTKPYGFVPPNAKIWFQKFVDDGQVEREYLVTEGYIWTAAYPESQRIFTEDGNNQSMELYKDSVKGYWAGNINSDNRFFIFNEAIIEKLCILGEDFEPCFEGSQIKAQFSLEEEFSQLKNTMYSMMNELKEALNKGGSETFMSQELNTPVIEEQENTIVTIEENPTGEFVKDDEKEEKKKEESQDNSEKEESKESEDKSEGEKPEDKKEDKEEDKKSKYILEEVVEYTELKAEYDALVEKYSALEQENANLQAEVQPLKEFKLEAEKQSKMEMINSFYMLSDEDKKDVIENINEYSLDDIEAKLAVICVRNKVSFSLEEEKAETEQMMFSLNDSQVSDDTPEWLKAVRTVASEM